MKTIVNNMLLVGNLQMLALPQVSLYIDEGRNVLFLFFRISAAGKTDCEYLVTEVSPKAVSQYMDGMVPLYTLYKDSSCMCMEIMNKKIYRDDTLPSYPIKEKLERAGLFDPEFCHEQIEIECFLDSFINNKTA